MDTSYNPSEEDWGMEGFSMGDKYGSDFLTITDDDGNEYELEVLSTVEYNGCNYLAVLPVDGDENDLANFQVCIIKSVEEDGEPVLYTVDDELELQAVNNLIMDSIYPDQTDD